MILEIVALGEIAVSGTIKLIKRYREKIDCRFRADLIKSIEKKEKDTILIDSLDLSDTDCIIEVGKGGIFAALWDLGETIGTGIRINLKNIPVSQEIIEICNYLDVNPYELESRGLFLFAVESGYSFCENLKAAGYRAEIIGFTTKDNDRIIYNGDSVRYIDKNRGKEELERVFKNE